MFTKNGVNCYPWQGPAILKSGGRIVRAAKVIQMLHIYRSQCVNVVKHLSEIISQ